MKIDGLLLLLHVMELCAQTGPVGGSCLLHLNQTPPFLPSGCCFLRDDVGSHSSHADHINNVMLNKNKLIYHQYQGYNLLST